MRTEKDIVYISSISWDFSWHRQQEMMNYLSNIGYRILFVEPCNKKHPFQKYLILQKKNIWRLRPQGLPYERCLRGINILNGSISKGEIIKAVQQLGFTDPIFWLDRVHGVDFRYFQQKYFTVYDLVDEILSFGRFRNEKMLINIENCVLQNADLLISSSQTLLDRKLYQSSRHGKSLFLPNGVDCDRFNKVQLKTKSEKLTLGFVGDISKRRLNYTLIAGIAKRKPEWSLKFVGPGTIESKTELAALADNIVVSNAVSGEEIPQVIGGFDIGIIPYNVEKKDMDYVFPRKACEYLAAGKPVISTPLNEVKILEPYVQIARDADEFIEKIEIELEGDISSFQRRSFAQRFDWHCLMKNLVKELLIQ